MNVIIREMCIEDYDELVALWERAKLSYKPFGRDRKDRINRELEQPQSLFLVAEVDGKIVGSVLGTHDGRKGWINRVSVDPQFRRQGIAKKLITMIEKYFGSSGIDIIACLIEDSNTLSSEIFQRLGYIPHHDITYYTKRKSFDV